MMNLCLAEARMNSISLLACDSSECAGPAILGKISTSRKFQPPWKELTYRADAYPFEGVETFPATPAHQLSVFNSGDGGVTMREFEALGYNCSKS